MRVVRCFARGLAGLSLLAGVNALSAVAKGDVITELGDAAFYGVLTGPGIGNFQLTSDTVITGNIGVGSSNGLTTGTNNNIQFSNSTLHGNLYLGGTNTNGIGGTVTGTITKQFADVATAYNTASSLSNLLAGETATALTLTGNAQMITASSGHLDANGNEVFSVSASSFNGAGPLTISGSASDNVVIDITGNNNFNFSKGISLTGGITANNIIYNITGTGNIGAAANGAVINGTIIGLKSKFNLDSVVIDGRIIGGAAGQDFQLVSNFKLNQPDSPVGPNVSAVPSPSVAAGGLACMGMLMLGALRRGMVRTRWS